MHDASHIRPQLVNQKMHRNFAGNRPSPRNPAAIHIHDHQIRRLHHALAHGRRGGEDMLGVKAHRKIAIHRSHIAALMQRPSK